MAGIRRLQKETWEWRDRTPFILAAAAKEVTTKRLYFEREGKDGGLSYRRFA